MEFSPKMLNNCGFFLYLKVKNLMKTIQPVMVYMKTRLMNKFLAEFYGDIADKKAFP